jgi:hypothetical protein
MIRILRVRADGASCDWTFARILVQQLAFVAIHVVYITNPKKEKRGGGAAHISKP